MNEQEQLPELPGSVRVRRRGIKRPSWIAPVEGVGDWVGLSVGFVVVCAIIALVTWNVVRLSEGKVTLDDLACIDPTDSCNFSKYRVQNDTTRPVVLRECSHHCGEGDRRLDPIDVAAGGLTPDDEFSGVTALVGKRAWWEVRTRTGQLLGCLVLDGHPHKRDGDLVAISAARPCGTHAAATPVAKPYNGNGPP
jgi:hypothetical protein